ncbi:DUF4238 domain-containing protein [Escherichia coli]|nr:DUF4238 domain-containing protein [Escherichia coli]
MTSLISSQKVSKQHFVPQYYIKQFYNKNNKVYRGCIKYNHIKEVTAAQTFYVPGLYDIEILGMCFNKIESYYSMMENYLSQLYNRLPNINDEHIMNADMTKTLKSAIAMQYFRTKDMNYDIFTHYCTNLVSIYNEKKDFMLDEFSFINEVELSDFEKRIKKGVRKNKKYALGLIRLLQYTVLPFLLADFKGGNIKIIYHKTNKYISSDKPVVCTNIEEILRFENFLYPLAPNILVYSLGADVTEELIRDENKVNEYIYKNAKEYIFSEDETKITRYLKN